MEVFKKDICLEMSFFSFYLGEVEFMNFFFSIFKCFGGNKI